MKRFILFLLLAGLVAGCGGSDKNSDRPVILDASDFETSLDGRQVSLYTLANDNGMTVQLTNYGARLVSLWVPDSRGRWIDVILGFDAIEKYLNAADRFNGPVVGRFGNRIADARFTLDGTEYRLEANERGNHLHGGNHGFFNRVWDARPTTDPDGNPAVEMSCFSPDGEAGYPGNLSLRVLYSLTPDNRLILSYRAETDAPTILNPTSHAYFNLHGKPSESTNSHLLIIDAQAITPVNANLIPTGEIRPVEGTVYDFRQPRPIDRFFTEGSDSVPAFIGYDHNFVLSGYSDGAGVFKAAEVYEPATGVVMEIYTDQPALQFYNGSGMKGIDVGKNGDLHGKYAGIALEAQNFPDAPNHGHFPSAVLRPGEVYTQTTIYAFGTR